MAIVPPPRWTPQDDLLLKNAVEAGASLESLAKGVRQFSQKFTVKELQDRWYSLLYDPVVSEKAAAQISGLENFELTRLTNSGSVKESACSYDKRKAESIQTCYYAMRKRICSEPVGMADTDLLSRPGKTNSECGKRTSFTNCGTADSIPNSFGTHGPDNDMRQYSLNVFPHSASESNHNAQNLGEDSCLGGNSVNNFSFPCEESITCQLKESHVLNLFEAENLHSGFANSEIGGTSFHSFGSSSSLEQMMPVWETLASDLLIESGEQIQLPHADNVNLAEASRGDGNPLNPSIKISMSSDGIEFLTPSTEDYLAHLFDLPNDEPLLEDIDGKDALAKSYLAGLSSLLLDSPCHTESLNAGLGEPVVAADGDFIGTSALCSGGSDNEVLNNDATQVPCSGLTDQVLGPEYRNGVICCTFNTEDPEIPDNDDVFLAYGQPSTNSRVTNWRLPDKPYHLPSFVNDSLSNQMASRGPHMMNTNQNDNLLLPHVGVSSKQLDRSSNSQLFEQKVEFELVKCNTQLAVSRSSEVGQCPTDVDPENVCADNLIGRSSCSFLEDFVPDIARNYEDGACGSRRGGSARSGNLTSGIFHADSSEQRIVPEAIDNSLLSDQEKLSPENDFDVPYYSDVEAMILDMDLSPDEFDLDTHPEVQNYQHEEAKRAIIRLEQGANACMQRAMEAKGALAVLYSHYLKHYILKPEVIIGRATEDIKVDIDLGREKNCSKISRRQALLMMDMHGSFHIKNLGRSSIYVNGKEVLPGTSLSLDSGSFLEIRGLTFAFETNHSVVKSRA